MISVVICSKDPVQFEAVKNNISQTIGIDHEIILIENSAGSVGICEAYNRGIEKAIFELVCFTHEDVYFETNEWGKKVVAHLSDPSVGLIGIAGGDTKALVPSSWSSLIFPSEISIVQHYKGNKKEMERIVRTGYPEMGSTAKPVICIDGVWMCTRKNVLSNINFDNQTFKGFHGYDIDFSLQVASHYKIMVVFDIILHHFSEGSFDKEWLMNAIKLSNKWKNHLPLSVRNLSRKELVSQHWTAMRNFLVKSRELNLGILFELKSLFGYSFTGYFHWKHFLHFLKVIVLRQSIKKY